MLNIIICDDDEKFAQKLKTDIHSIIGENPQADKLDYSCEVLYPAERLLRYAENNHIDILFLDIRMPDIGGLEIAERFYEEYKDTKIIFVSLFDDYVFYSIRFNPFRFIRKSNLSAELTEAVNAAVNDILLSDKHLVFDGKSEKFSIKISRITYAVKEKHSNYIRIICQNEEYRVRGTVNAMMIKLSKMGFVRVNSGTIVNMKYIFSIREDQVILTDDSHHIISRNLKEALTCAYFRYMRNMNGGV